MKVSEAVRSWGIEQKRFGSAMLMKESASAPLAGVAEAPKRLHSIVLDPLVQRDRNPGCSPRLQGGSKAATAQFNSQRGPDHLRPRKVVPRARRFHWGGGRLHHHPAEGGRFWLRTPQLSSDAVDSTNMVQPSVSCARNCSVPWGTGLRAPSILQKLRSRPGRVGGRPLREAPERQGSEPDRCGEHHCDAESVKVPSPTLLGPGKPRRRGRRVQVSHRGVGMGG